MVKAWAILHHGDAQNVVSVERRSFLSGPCGRVGDVVGDTSPDVCITDPPYNIGLDAGTGRDWDRFRSNSAFMEWTSEWAKVVAGALPTGSLIGAFSARNTMHAVMFGFEKAGLDILDVPLWIYATGQVKHKAKLKPAYEPFVVGRMVAPGINERFATTGHGLFQAQDLKAEDGRHPMNILGVEEVATTSGDLVDFSRFLYVAKASRADRDYGLGDQPVRQRESDLSGVTLRCTQCDTPFVRVSPKRIAEPCGTPIGLNLVPCNGKLRYSRGLSSASGQGRNPHPTVKPIDLMRRLVRMMTRPGMTVLDPFCGSATTGVACLLEGRNFIGIEREKDFYDLSLTRLRNVYTMLENKTI